MTCVCVCSGGSGQSQHGEADVLRLVRSGEAGSYCCVLVRASDQRPEPSPLRVGAQAQQHTDVTTDIILMLLLRYVCIAMEAMEQLLLACHCQSINLLVESFLSMLRLLLEADKPHLHILATNSVSSNWVGPISSLTGGPGPGFDLGVTTDPSLLYLCHREPPGQ